MIYIKTYQDLLAIGENEKSRMDFILSAINEHKSSASYRTAMDADLYYRHQNPTIMRFQKLVYNQFGKAVPDIWSPNNKIASNWYFYFVVQSVQFLLGNGVSFDDDTAKGKLGADFDEKVQKLATYAKNSGVGFGAWNVDHLDVFSLTEFVPLWDEHDGSLKAGIRFWQIADDKPLRATLYELDGYTEYIREKNVDMRILSDKRTYKQNVVTADVGGEQILAGENYPTFPIVPLWNINRQSDLVGNQNTIDAYDLMQSKLINNVSQGDLIYWILKNSGGMSGEDSTRFIEQILTTHVYASDDENSKVDSHKVDTPFEASQAALKSLENQLYKDFMALNVENISSASVTATQIQAAYEPINQKTDQFEYCVTAFISEILRLAGIDAKPSYTRSQMSNQTELANVVLTSAQYLDEEYVTKKLLTLLGDGDQFDEVMQRKAGDVLGRYELVQTEE